MSSLSAEEVIDTFVVEHRPSEVNESDGTRHLSPPRNVVVFDPAQE